MPTRRRFVPFPLRARTASGARTGRLRRTLAALCLGASSLALAGTGIAFDDLNPAQTLVYDRPHLASTETGDELVYRYRAEVADAAGVDDRATLVVDAVAGPERRDVTLDFLDGERRLELPPFTGYRGNPILIATLEHFAQTLAAAAGGGPLYVRNRIRDGFARDDVSIVQGTAERGEATIETVTLAFSPFASDAFLGARPGIGDATFRIVFSDDVPGGVLSIEARSGESAASARPAPNRPAAVPFVYELRLDDATSG